MFESTVEKFVKTVGDDICIPVSSLASSESNQVLSVVERKASKWWFGKNKYRSTEFSLKDILTGDEPNITVENAKPMCTFNKSAVIKVNGKFSTQIKSIFSAELDNVENITIKAPIGDVTATEVHQQSLLDAVKGRSINMNHELVRELTSKKRRALCVIVMVAKTVADSTLEATLNMKVSGDSKVNPPVLKSVISGELSGGVEDAKSRELKLPAGTVLAYEALELQVSNTGVFRVMVDRESTGGFNAKVDQVDTPHVTTTAAQLFNGFNELPDDKHKKVLALIQNMCADPVILGQVMGRLVDTQAEVNQQVEDLVTLLGNIADVPDNPCNVSIRALCKALRDLDVETLSYLPPVSASQGVKLMNILKKTKAGNLLSTDDADVRTMFDDDNPVKEILEEGLEFTVHSGNLIPPKNSQVMLENAYLSAYGLFIQ